MAKVSTIVSTATIVKNHTYVAMKNAVTASANFAPSVDFIATIMKSMYVRGSQMLHMSVTTAANAEDALLRSLYTLLQKRIRSMNLYFQNPAQVSILPKERLPGWTIS